MSERHDKREPELELVPILETGDRVALDLARGSLDEAGIPYFILDSVGSPIFGAGSSFITPARIQVAREWESEAKELLMPLLYPERGDKETS